MSSNKNIQKMKGYALGALSVSQAVLYTLESIPLLYSRKAFGLLKDPHPLPPKDYQNQIREEFKSLLLRDMENVEKGLYDLNLFPFENPAKHMMRYSKLLVDALQSSWRQKSNKHDHFSKEAQKHLKDLPEYYTRNFHFQTDGYLSDKSAELYNHQTEILFKGSIGLMRRILMSPLIEKAKHSDRPLKILEVACGSGETTEILLKTVPRVFVTAVDISAPYLEFAKKKTSSFKNVKFQKMNAEQMNFHNEFDMVVCSYLFHELPHEVRKKILKNIYKSLKPNGSVLLIDSLQLGDTPSYDWALHQFPKDFHEPFYKNYIQHPLEKESFGDFRKTSIDQAFLSKSVFLENKVGNNI